MQLRFERMAASKQVTGQTQNCGSFDVLSLVVNEEAFVR